MVHRHRIRQAMFVEAFSYSDLGKVEINGS